MHPLRAGIVVLLAMLSAAAIACARPAPAATAEPAASGLPAKGEAHSGAEGARRPGTSGPAFYRLVPAARSPLLIRPVGLAPLPGSRDEVIVINQGGLLLRVRLGSGEPPSVFGSLSALIRDPVARNEEGLLGIAFSPDFEEDRTVYLFYTARASGRNVLSRFRVRDGHLDTGSEELLLEVAKPFTSHNGGQLAFGPDGYLYLATGDGGGSGDPHRYGQATDNLLSAILRIDVSAPGGYRIPLDNPFVWKPAARREIYAYGLRNPWRFSFDRLTGDLWAGDVGQERWEEVNLIRPGGNYGWSVMEGPDCFVLEDCDRSPYEPPRFVYSHDEGCAIIGGYVYRGSLMPELYGRYVYGDFCSGHVSALDLDTGTAVVLAGADAPISSLGELPDGELAVLTFDGSVLALALERERPIANPAEWRAAPAQGQAP